MGMSLSDEFESRTDAYKLQREKFKALRDALGNYGDFRYVNLNDFLNPDNQNWADYTYKTPGGLFSTSQGHINAASPEGILINNIRNAENFGEVWRQSDLWDRYDPLSSPDNGKSYAKYVIPLQAAYDRLKSINAQSSNNRSDTPAPDQPPQYGGPLVRRQKLEEAIENSNDSNPYLGGNYGSRRPGWGLVEENPQPQAPAPASADVTADVMKALKADGNTSFANWRQSLVNQGWDGDPSKIKYDPSTGKFMSNGGGQAFKGTGKPRKVRQGRSSGNLSRSGGNTYATAGIPKGGVVSPATMMRTSGVPPVQAGYGMNVPIGEEEPDYTLTYDAKTSSMKPNDPYSYYDPSRNPPNEYIYDPITHELVRR